MLAKRAKNPKFRRRCLIFSLVMVVAMGCSAWQGRNNAWDLNVRPVSGDANQVLRNASYYMLMGRSELALKELEEAHQLDPDNLKLSDRLAGLYEHLGHSERAQQVYLEAIARDPDNQALHNNLCYSYYQAGNLAQAEACFRKMLARDPKSVKARNNLGLVLCRLGRQQEARQLWQEAEGGAAADQKLSQALAFLHQAGAPVAPAPTAAVRPLAPAPEPQASAPPVAAAKPLAAPESGPAKAALSQVPPIREVAAPAPAALKAPGTAPAASTAAAAPAAPEPQAATAPQAAPAAAAPPTPEAAVPAPATQPGPIAPAAAAPAPDKPAALAEAKPAPPAPAAQDPQPEAKPTTPPTAAVKPRAELPVLPGHPLTCLELVETGIEVYNGNGIPNLARETRSRLELEGFTVVDIGNYKNFALERTMIYHRPGAARVARVLGAKFFPGAELEAEKELAEGVDVEILLGHDLPRRQADAAGPAKDKSL
jgi:Flp pilus assembly protein TadD